ncbi:MAG: GNAT family N-acetyltransferase [Granulosicoccus sp.]
MDSLTLRPVNVDDAQIIWTWRNSEGAHKYYKNPTRQTLEDHTAWINSAISDSKNQLWIIEDNGEPVSHVRIDFVSERIASVSIVVDPTRYGKGYGKQSLFLVLDGLISNGISVSIFAEIHIDNIASRKLFEAAGFQRHSECAPFLSYMLSLRGERVKMQGNP